MNGWVKSSESNDIDSYESQRKYFFDRAATLIEKELPVMQASQAAFYTNSKAGDAKINIGDVTKILDAVKPSEKQK